MLEGFDVKATVVCLLLCACGSAPTTIDVPAGESLYTDKPASDLAQAKDPDAPMAVELDAGADARPVFEREAPDADAGPMLIACNVDWNCESGICGSADDIHYYCYKADGAAP